MSDKMVELEELEGVGRKFRGKLTSYDEHMNMVLEDTEELTEKGPIKHKFVLLKGGNVTDIST